MVTWVRPLRSVDIPAVLAIETEANSVPWRASDFSAFVPKEQPSILGVEMPLTQEAGGQHMAWVYADPEVRGFLCALGAADEVELQSLAVEKARWGLGIGSALMDAMLVWARSEQYRAFHLEVRENNVRAFEFYRRWGFARVGRRPNYYSDNGEAALLMSLEFGP